MEGNYDQNVKIENHLVGAILVTIFCCIPFGIAAIVNASKVNNLVAAGDTAGARDASEKAKKWIIVSIVLGIIGTVISVIAQLSSGGY